MTGIEFRGLVKRFGETQVLAGVNLVIAPGTVHFVIGVSGAGKSVLMKHVVGLLRADAGQVLFEGRDITAYEEPEFCEVRKRVGYVFQHATLLDALDILDNIALPLRLRLGLPLRRAKERALEELERLHLTPWARRFPAELGVGLKKRAAVARALALEPSYLIYDEPTTGLDPVSARRMDRLVAELASRGLTQVIVSHDRASILSVAERVSLLHRGVVHYDGTPTEIRASPDPAVRQFFSGSPAGPLSAAAED